MVKKKGKAVPRVPEQEVPCGVQRWTVEQAVPLQSRFPHCEPVKRTMVQPMESFHRNRPWAFGEEPLEREVWELPTVGSSMLEFHVQTHAEVVLEELCSAGRMAARGRDPRRIR